MSIPRYGAHIALSSNGRTAGSDPASLGSNPSEAFVGVNHASVRTAHRIEWEHRVPPTSPYVMCLAAQKKGRIIGDGKTPVIPS